MTRILNRRLEGAKRYENAKNNTEDGGKIDFYFVKVKITARRKINVQSVKINFVVSSY